MKFKRLLVFLLAIMMLLSIMPAAYAAEIGDESGTTEPTEFTSNQLEQTDPTDVEENTEPPPDEYNGELDPALIEAGFTTDQIQAGNVLLEPISTFAASTRSVKKTATLRNCNWMDFPCTDNSRQGFHYADEDGTAPWDYMNMIYCLENKKDFSYGSGHAGVGDLPIDGSGDTHGESIWYGFSADQRVAIALTMLYGAPTKLWDESWGINATDDWNLHNPNIGYRFATQAIIWELVQGLREPTPPYKLNSTYWLDKSQGVCMSEDGTVDHFMYAYNSIINDLQMHNVIPSFTGDFAATAPEILLAGNSTTVTDTNGVLGRFTFNSSGGISYSKNGNNLTITANGAIPTDVQSATATLPDAASSLYRVYQDKGYSGKNTDRPGFQEMLAAIRRGEIQRVICYKLDRCSRSLLDFANMMEEFQHCKVEFVSCTEKFDTSTPMGRAMLSICIVFAQLERETIQQRVTDAYHSRSQKGFYMGGRIPYAFQLEPYAILGKKTSRYVACPDEAEILYQIYLYYSDPQVSVGDVITYLESNEIKNSRSKDGHWSKSYITNIIKNPIYVKADIEVYHFFKNQGASILNNPEDFIGTNGCYLFTDSDEKRKTLRLEGHKLVIAPHQGFIPSDLWLKCRRKCMNNKQVAKPVKAKNTWLAGKLKCPLCGYGLIIRKWKYNRYYMCSHRLNNIDSCEGVGGLIAEDIEQIIFDALKKKITDLGALHNQSVVYDNPRIGELKIKIAQAQKEIELYISKMSQANETVLRYINEKIADLDAKKEVWERELGQLEDQKRSTTLNLDEISDCMNYWEMLSNPDKLKIVDAFILSISASKEGVSIQWKL